MSLFHGAFSKVWIISLGCRLDPKKRNYWVKVSIHFHVANLLYTEKVSVRPAEQTVTSLILLHPGWY